MPYTVLFLDDEAFFASSYIERLQPDFDVHYHDNVREVLDALHSGKYDGLILDIMMPTTKETPGDVLSIDMGLWVLSEVKKTIMDGPLPVLILTNRDVEHVRKHVTILGFPDGVIEVYRKIDMPAKRLPLILQTLLRRWHGSKGPKKTVNGTDPSR
jgi:CheY-like chemotaxis protein